MVCSGPPRSALLLAALLTLALPACGGGASGAAGAAGAAGANVAGAGASGAGGSGAGGAGGSAAGGEQAGGEQAGGGGGSAAGAGGAPPVIGGDRPVKVIVPSAYDPSVPAPLLVMLHGYGVTGLIEELFLGLKPTADQQGFLYAHPDGLVDSMGNHFWNASDACCNYDNNPVDDAAYLAKVVTDIQANYNVDPKRIYFVGHSNGGFMAHRMACEHADLIAAIGSLAGEMPEDLTKCKPSQPVAVLQIQGTADATIAYNGGSIVGHAFPSAKTSIEDWATLDGCSLTPDTSSPPLDLETTIPGAETTVSIYSQGCQPGGYAELWSIAGGSHIPSLNQPTFNNDLFDFLMAHPKP